MKIKHFVALILVCALVAVFFVGCDRDDSNENPEIVTYDQIKNIPDDSCYIEWINKDFNTVNPTVIWVHGEMAGAHDEKVTLTLTEENYITYAMSSTSYNVGTGVLDGTVNNGYRDLAYYWTRQGYNVGIFHYEKFADDELNNIIKKLFSVNNMTYKKADSSTETAKLPNYNLTEILAAVLIKSVPDAARGEIRLVGNGVGAVLALSATDYIYTHYGYGNVSRSKVPMRLAFIDPYLPTEQVATGAFWREMDTAHGVLSVAEDMLKNTAGKGLVAEMIENTEVTSTTVDNTSVEVRNVPYPSISYNDEQNYAKNRLIENTAYLSLTQKYSVLFPESYKAKNRAGLDWYMYSVNGSDNGGSTSSKIGWGNNDAPDYTSTYCNWGPNSTRPILNDRQRSNNSSSKGKNYGVSAWTHSSWTRALRGIRFNLLRYSKTKTDANGSTMYDIHGEPIYEYTNYVVPTFTSEIYEKAINLNATLVCGYVFNDENEDRLNNDGFGSGISGVTINCLLTKSVSSETVTVKNFSVKTESDGFFVIKLEKDDKGEDISFENSHSFELTIVPKNSTYHFQTAGTTTYHYADLGKHTFEMMSKTLTMQRYYSNAITMASCGVVIKK